MKNNIGGNIKKLRQENNLTQEVLADRLGVSVSVIKKWESNRGIPKLTSQEMICDYFNVDMNYLLGLTPIKVALSEDNIIQVPLYDCSRLDDRFKSDCILNTLVIPKYMLKDGADYFAICIRDYSVMDCDLKKGDIAVFEKSRHISPFQVGLFLIDDVVYCRHYVMDKKTTNLRSYNADYVSFNNISSFIVLGKLALTISNTQLDFTPEPDF